MAKRSGGPVRALESCGTPCRRMYLHTPLIIGILWQEVTNGASKEVQSMSRETSTLVATLLISLFSIVFGWATQRGWLGYAEFALMVALTVSLILYTLGPA